MQTNRLISRREFLAASAAVCASTAAVLNAAESQKEPIVDIHQHTNYSGRTNEQLLHHQKTLGITTTVLLPAGSHFGLDAGCGGNESVRRLARLWPSSYVFFSNEVADLEGATDEIKKYLDRGAIGIGEQKFRVDCDSPHIIRIAELAKEYQVPVLLHFQHNAYNTAFERFHKVLEKFPTVNFIGHAQTWWGNIDAKHVQEVLYPKGKVTPGGITDRLLADYPNMYGDLSAGSGLNALLRDQEHARGFLDRHQDKLMYGSDCNDAVGKGEACQGAQTLEAIRRLVPNKQAERKILYANAVRVLRLSDRRTQ